MHLLKHIEWQSQHTYDHGMNPKPLLLDSITDVSELVRERIVVSGSHGGHYPAALASHAGVGAVLFNDAGIGLEDAGVAGVLSLSKVGMAAAAVDCMSCRIGSAQDAVDRGRISVANAVAAELGIRAGMTVDDAVNCLGKGPLPHGILPDHVEARQSVALGKAGPVIWLLDSASLVRPEDEGQIVITGSHGGLIGGDPARALKAAARIAVFNDAGVGLDDVGISRLPALDQKSIAAVTVSCMSARIGDAVSALETGVISHANDTAVKLGAAVNLSLKVWLKNL